MAKGRGRVYNRIFTKTEWEQVNPANIDIMEDYLMEMKQRKKKESTIKQYKNDLRIIMIYVLRNLKNKCILDCSKKDFRKINLWFLEELQLSNARANRLMSAVRSMLDYIEEDDDDYGDYENNVAKKIKGLPKEAVKEIVFLSDAQVMKLKDELINKGEYQKATLLMLAYDSAGRRNELHQVLKDGFLEKDSTNIVTGKRGKRFPLIYFIATKDVAELYLKQRGEDDIESLWTVGQGEAKRAASYETLYSWFVDMADLLEEIEGKNIPFGPHSLRHSALENMSTGDHYICKVLGKDDGFDLNELKVYAHHENTSTTEGYLKSRDNEILSNMFGIKVE